MKRVRYCFSGNCPALLNTLIKMEYIISSKTKVPQMITFILQQSINLHLEVIILITFIKLMLRMLYPDNCGIHTIKHQLQVIFSIKVSTNWDFLQTI
jgi:hypothetical protein